MKTATVLLFLSAVLSADSSLAAEWITNDGCDLMIAFPGEPTVADVSTFGLRGKSYQYAHSEILRAEFLKSEENLSEVAAAQYEEILTNYAIGNGFQNWYLSLHLDESLPHGFVRGNKEIDGKPVIYKATLYVREQCALVVMVGTLASMFPTNWITDFERSVQLK